MKAKIHPDQELKEGLIQAKASFNKQVKYLKIRHAFKTSTIEEQAAMMSKHLQDKSYNYKTRLRDWFFSFDVPHRLAICREIVKKRMILDVRVRESHGLSMRSFKMIGPFYSVMVTVLPGPLGIEHCSARDLSSPPNDYVVNEWVLRDFPSAKKLEISR